MTPPRTQRSIGIARLCTRGLFAVLLCLPSTGHALDLAFPADAQLVNATDAVEGLHPIATAPWSVAGLPTQDTSGVVQEFTWQITENDITTANLAASLREQMEAQGYDITFSCFADGCGGFDFRHALPVGDAPEMYVDLGNFHYLSAASSTLDSHAALMISRGGTIGFVHLALVQPPNAVAAPVVQSTRTPDVRGDTPPPTSDLVEHLIAMGSVPLDDLQFETGASSLSGERYPSLEALAAYLNADSSRIIVLVGHTDASGSLSGNISLSEARANAVRQFLTDEMGVAPAQVAARGIGFLSPRASNTTPEGREANRRVEVVLTASN